MPTCRASAFPTPDSSGIGVCFKKMMHSKKKGDLNDRQEIKLLAHVLPFLFS